MNTVYISMDKTFPDVDEFQNVKSILKDSISNKSDPKIKIKFDSRRFRTIHVSDIHEDDTDEVIEQMFTHGYPARKIK